MGNSISSSFQSPQSMVPRYTTKHTPYEEPEKGRITDHDVFPCNYDFYRNRCRVLEAIISDAEEILTKHSSAGRNGTVPSPAGPISWPQPALLELRRLVKVGKTLIQSCHDEPCFKAYLRRSERTLAFAESLKEIVWCMSVGFYHSARSLESYPAMAMNEFPLPELGAHKELCMMLEAAAKDEQAILESLDVWIPKHRCSVRVCGGPQQQAAPEEPPLCIASQISERRRKPNGAEADHTSVLWNVNSKILKDGAFIASGGHCSILETTWLGDTYAKKRFRMETRSPVFRNEANALSKLSHPHMVTVLAYSESSQVCSLLMEKMPLDLSQYMQNRQEKDRITPPFSLPGAVDLMLQVAEAMKYMHSQGMVHRDLKPGNILVQPILDDPELARHGFVIAKLADFGLAKSKGEVTAFSHMTANQGTTRWMAPEVFGGNRRNDERRSTVAFPRKADVWSFCIVCSEVLTGTVPYEKVSLSALHKQLTDKDHPLRPELPERCPESLASLIRQCWHIDPLERPSFQKICKKLRYLKGLLMLTDGGELEPWMEEKLQSLDSTVDVELKHELCIMRVPNTSHHCCLYYTTFDGSSWTKAVPLPYFMASVNGMSLAKHGITLVGVHRGLEEKQHPRQLYWNTYTSSSWSEARPIVPQTSPSRPGLVAFKERFFCLYRGEGNEIWCTSAPNSNLFDWTTPVNVDHSFRTSDGPAIASYGQDHLISVARGFDNCIYWDQYSFHDSMWHGYKKMENLASTSGSPALAIYNNELYCCVRGTDIAMPGRLYWGKFSFNKWSSFSQVDYNFFAFSGPSLAVFNDQLVCTMQGPHHELHYTIFNGSRWSKVSMVPSQVPCIGEQGLCAFDFKLFCVYGAL